jgi:Antitoxin SocA-like, Panacea domain
MGLPRIDTWRRLWYRARYGGDEMTNWRTFHFEREKFIELLLYFSKRGIDEDLVIGSTKLNKLLFFTDMRAFTELGDPVTGARYFRLEFGPAARAMLPVRNELIDTDQVEFEGHDPDNWNDVIVPKRDPDLSLFTEDEFRIANEVFDEMRKFNATAISDYSHHKSAGWKVMENEEDIPYEAAFVLTEPAPAEAIELGRELAVKYNW